MRTQVLTARSLQHLSNIPDASKPLHPFLAPWLRDLQSISTLCSPVNPSSLPRLRLKCSGLSKARCLCNPGFLLTSSLERPWNDEKVFPKKDDKLTRIGPHGKQTWRGGCFTEFFRSNQNINTYFQISQSFVRMPKFLPRKDLFLASFLHPLWCEDPKEHSLTLHWVSWDEVGLDLMLSAIGAKTHSGFAGTQLQGRCDAWHGGSASCYLCVLAHET